MRCASGKRSFDTSTLAEEALIENHIRFNHPTGVGPINFYICQDCGLYHFTSKGEINAILEERSDYIRKQQLARNWESKLR